MVSRREFVLGASALAVEGIFAAGEDAPSLRFGVLSDVHLSGKPGTEMRLRRALAELDARRVDAIVVSGDLTCWATDAEFKAFAAAWDAEFPGGRGFDGRPVTRLLVSGNHDVADLRQRQHGRKPELRDMNGIWRSCFGEEYSPVTLKSVKGFDFVLVNYGHERDVSGWYGRNGARLKGKKPFFHVQHRHPKGTCFGGDVACDAGTVTPVLSAYANCFAISGHSHRPLSEETALWQGAFTSMGAATLQKPLFPLGYENSRLKERPMVSQGAIIEVCGSSIRIERLDFALQERVGPDWRLSLPLETHPERPFVFAAKGSAPHYDARQFRLKVTRRGEKVRLEIPPPWTPNPWSRVIGYEVSVSADGSKRPFAVRRVLADGYYLPFEKARVRKTFVEFGKDALPEGKAVFRVRAHNAAGVYGEELTS